MTLIHFILFILIECIFILVLFYKTGLSTKKIALLTSILFYILIIGYTFYLKHKYKVELNKYDINNDGFFNGNEINTEQKKATKNVISDTGRNFAPFIAILYSTLHFFILKMILDTFKKTATK